MDEKERRLLKLRQLKLLKNKQKIQNRKEIAKSETELAQRLAAAANKDESEEGEPVKKVKKDAKSKRIEHLNYSIDEYDKWDEKTLSKRNGRALNFEELADTSYLKASSTTKVDIELYNRQTQREGDQMNYNSKVPKQKLALVVNDYKELNERKKGKLDKKSRKSGADVGGFINDKNKQFNEKLDRHYGKYTKELKDSFERGSAI